MKYVVVSRNSINDLMTAVNSLLDEGWELIGGVAIDSLAGSYGKVIVLQAMQRIEPTNEQAGV